MNFYHAGYQDDTDSTDDVDDRENTDDENDSDNKYEKDCREDANDQRINSQGRQETTCALKSPDSRTNLMRLISDHRIGA